MYLLQNTSELKDLVKKARLYSDLTQSEFCKILEKSQSTVSKYESGSQLPPGSVIIRCIRLTGKRNAETQAEAEDEIWKLLQKVARLSTPEYAKAREVLGSMLDVFLAREESGR